MDAGGGELMYKPRVEPPHFGEDEGESVAVHMDWDDGVQGRRSRGA